MKITPISKIIGGQDGAFLGEYMLRFSSKGEGMVFDASSLGKGEREEATLPLLSRFSVKAEEPLVPHFNAVVLGNEYYAEGDEFPLLYANVYNNYAAAPDRREGTLCAYRVQREGVNFSMTLVQVIRVGFVHDPLWRSEGVKDARPYGNFVIDTKNALLYAFTMRDGEKRTRYFSFRLPKASDGVLSEEYGVRLVTLTKEDIISSFDTEYHAFIQGACFHEGKIYSSEGFSTTPPAALRVIDPEKKAQVAHFDLADAGYPEEAEWIDFKDGVCYYSDITGNLFRVDL